MQKKNLIDHIGNTPLIYIESLSKLTGCEIYGKAEFMNPGGSVKDRAALGMIRDAEKKGLLKKGGLIVEATAGNTGIGLALIGNLLGYRTKFLMPSNMSEEKVVTLRGMGAEVLSIPPAPYPSPENYRILAAKIAEEEGAFYVNQFENESNHEIHYSTTAPEIWDQTDGEITGFAAAIGSGGTLAGVSRYLKEKNPQIQVASVDPAGSAMYSYFTTGVAECSEGETVTEGIGQGAVTANVKPCQVDHPFQLSDEIMLNMVHYMVKKEGLFLGSSCGANLCGAYLLAKRMGPGNRIVTILCDSGQKYISKVFNPEFLKEKQLKVTGEAEDLFPALDRFV